MSVIASIISLEAAQADELIVAFKGEITQVADDLNWFNDSIQVGMPVGGAYSFFDAGYGRSDFSQSSFYEFDVEAKMNLTVGGQEYTTVSDFNPILYGILVTNDSDEPFDAAGDAYIVQSPLPFPDHFTYLTGEPANDPGGFYFPVVYMSLDLHDPTGTALSSNDLPLAPLGLADFASAVGHIYIADGNGIGRPDYAVADFRITSLHAVPEPTAFAICGIGLVIFAAVRRPNNGRQFRMKSCV